MIGRIVSRKKYLRLVADSFPGATVLHPTGTEPPATEAWRTLACGYDR